MSWIWGIGTPFALPSFTASSKLNKTKSALLNTREELDLFNGEQWIPSSRKARLAVEIALVSILTLVGLLVRLWDIGTSPGAPAGDESAVALETIRILHGEWIGMWSGAALGNPTGHMYWIAPFFWLGGPTLTALRLSSALPGIMLIPICYLMVRMLFPFKVAFVAVGLLTFFSWFVIIYRIGIPVTLSVFVAALSLCLVIYAARSSRLWAAILAGLVLGTGLYVFKGYVIYFFAIWAAAILAVLIHSGLRRQWTVYLFLAASIVAGAVMLEFYFATNYLSNNLRSQYGVGESDLLSLPRHLGRIFDVLLYVHLPPEAGGFGFDGIIPKPLLHPATAIFFWIGLLITLLFINRVPFQLLLLGWLIGMAPAILVPGGETRRYLFGVFFVLVITAIGYTSILSLIINRWLSLRDRGASFKFLGVKRRWLGYFLAAVATLIFMGSFAVQNLSAFNEWTHGQETKFQFDPEIAEAARFMGALDNGYAVRFYSVRWSVDYETIRWLAPSTQGIDGSREFGGDGTIFSSGAVEEPTVFMLLGGYLDLIDGLKATYPSGREHLETNSDGQPLFIAYTIDTPPPAGTVIIPPYYRLSPNPEEVDFRVGETMSFDLESNEPALIRVAVASSSAGRSNLTLRQDGECPGMSEYKVVTEPDQPIKIRACQPGQGEIQLFLAEQGTMVNSYTVEARDVAAGLLSGSDGGRVRITPDPAELTVRADPNKHHPFELVSSQSVLIIPRPAEAIVIHNNPDLEGKDGCEAVETRPEGDTRLSIILPNTGKEIRSPFYVVGCAAGPAALDIIGDGKVLATYEFTISGP